MNKMNNRLEYVVSELNIILENNSIPFNKFSTYFGFATGKNVKDIKDIDKLIKNLYACDVICDSFYDKQQLSSMRMRLMDIIKDRENTKTR